MPFQMHADYIVPVVFSERCKHAVSVVTCIIDNGMHIAKVFNRGGQNFACRGVIRDVVKINNRLTTCIIDNFDSFSSGIGVDVIDNNIAPRCP